MVVFNVKIRVYTSKTTQIIALSTAYRCEIQSKLNKPSLIFDCETMFSSICLLFFLFIYLFIFCEFGTMCMACGIDCLVYKHQCKIPVTIRSLLLCLLHGFPCRIYLLAHYAFVASKIRMVPQGNEINISNSAILLPISRPTSWQTLLILQDPTIINVNY